jgi:hypothetical protein
MSGLLNFLTGYRLVRGEDLNSNFSYLQNQAGPMSGPVYYVNENVGLDNNNGGTDPSKPLATIDAALTLERNALARLSLSTVGRNAVVAFWGSQHRTSSLVWSLPATHLVGIGGNELRGKRARISVTGSTGFNKLVQVTAQGCMFSNFATFYGWVDSSASLLCWSDEAGRSAYNNVEFMGFGDNTITTGSASLTGSRALKFSGSGETTFRDCVFGVDTTDRNATNYTVEIASSPGAPRMSFVDCVFECRLGASGGSGSHLLIGASGIDRYLDLVRCRFHNFSTTAMSQALNVSSSAGGTVFMDQCTFSGTSITAIQTTPTANMQINMVLATTGGGLTHQVF